MILVTGANGFVGSALCQRLMTEQRSVRAVTRRRPSHSLETAPFFIDAIDANTDWALALEGVRTVVHLAARVHVMRDRTKDPLAAFRTVNLAGTDRLAQQAARSGVKRFIYISSIKVNGESTLPGQPFRPEHPPNPQDPYSVSKYEAEEALKRIAKKTDMEVVIIRPPLVYGAGVKGNFETMVKIVQKGWPLPFAWITENRRSLLGLDNFIDLIIRVIDHPVARNRTFLVSDGEDLSTSDLLLRIGKALSTKVILMSVPPRLLDYGAHFFNQKSAYLRLCGSLQVDMTETRVALGWTPPLTVDEGLSRMLANAMS